MGPLILKADAGRLPLADRSVDLCIGSPPYLDARDYREGGRDLGIARKCEDWVSWMLEVTAEALRVSRGLVLWVCAGKTDGWCYQPGPEGLLWEWWRRGGECHCFRPCYWHRSGIPGSGGEQWYRADVESVLAFKRPGRLPFANPTANGHPSKWAPGGEMSHRLADGRRVNAFGVRTDGVRIGGTRRNGKKYTEEHSKGRRPHSKRDAAGGMVEQSYEPPALANPGNLFKTVVGGGHLGSRLAHENEAPYPVEVPGFFIASHTRPGDLVLDPFGGSGTTAHAAMEQRRRAVVADLRMSQCRLMRRRLASVTPGFAFAEDSP